MDHLQPWHWIVLLIIILVIFGPKNLPKIAESLRRAMYDDYSGFPMEQETVVLLKTGRIKKINLTSRQIVVMAWWWRTTFTVAHYTKIIQGNAIRKLEDIKAGAKVEVEYARDGGKNIAERILIETPK